MWAQRSAVLREAFLTVLRESYRSTPGWIDFRAAAEEARTEINRWIEEQTEGRIKVLLLPGMVGPDTRLVLTNTVLLKAKWSQPFLDVRTKVQPFFVSERVQVQASFMHQTGYFKAARVPGGWMLELPYAGGELVMNVILPKRRGGLPEMERALTSGTVTAWCGELRTMLVELAFPRWKTSATSDLGPPLQRMGMARAFNYPEADFSGIDGSRELYLSSVAQQARIEVTEEGTEAAAATALIAMAGGAGRSEPLPFHADHPFLFLIRDPTSGAVLFFGRVADPTAT
jgi:serpin B